MNENDTIQVTEFDNLVNKSQLQMIKAAIPYIPVTEQRFISIFVKVRELMNTVSLFGSDTSDSIGICSVEPEQSTPYDMLCAMQKYAEEPEKSTLDLILNFMEAQNLYKSYVKDLPEGENPNPGFGSGKNTMDILKNMLNPEQQSMLDTYQMLFQTMGSN